MAGWLAAGGLRDVLSNGIMDSQAADLVTYYSREGPRTISAIVIRDTEDSDVNIPRVVADALASDLDEQPIGHRVTYNETDYTIRELVILPDGWVQLVMHRT